MEMEIDRRTQIEKDFENKNKLRHDWEAQIQAPQSWSDVYSEPWLVVDRALDPSSC